MAKLSIPIPAGGLVVDKPAEYIDIRSISNCQNIEITRNLVRKRQGSEDLGASLGERILGQIELEVGINTYFVRVGLTDAEVIDKGTLAWTSIANAPLTATEESLVSFAFPLFAADRYLVYTNGVDNIRKYSGTGNDADLGGTPPKCKYLIDFKGYLVLAHIIDGGDTFFARVQWSDAGDPEEWDPITSDSGAIDLLDDSTEITGISRFGDFLAVHKESCIYLGQLVNTTDVFRFTKKEAAGTIANGSIQNLPDGSQIYLARDGIRLFNGVTSDLIPSPIIEELRDSINPEFVQRATSVLVKDLDEYWCGIPIGSQEEPETIYKYNYRTGQVYRDVRTGLMSLALYKKTGDDSWDSDPDPWDSDVTQWDSVTDLALHKQVAFGFENGLTTLRSSSANDSDDAIDAIWDTKDFTIADIDENKDIGNRIRWKGIQIWAKGNGVTAYYSIDSGSTWNLIGSMTLDSDYPTDDEDNTLYFDVLSSKLRIRLRNNTTSESFTLKQYVLPYAIREVRR